MLLSYTADADDAGKTVRFYYPTPATEQKIQPGSGAEQFLYHTNQHRLSADDQFLGSIIIRPHRLQTHIEVEDIRSRGGGVKHVESQQFVYDESPIDGIPYSTNAVVVIQTEEDKLDPALSMAREVIPFGHVAVGQRWDSE